MTVNYSKKNILHPIPKCGFSFLYPATRPMLKGKFWLPPADAELVGWVNECLIKEDAPNAPEL